MVAGPPNSSSSRSSSSHDMRMAWQCYGNGVQWCSHDMAMAWQWRAHVVKQMAWPSYGSGMASARPLHTADLATSSHCRMSGEDSHLALVSRADAHLGAGHRRTCTLRARVSGAHAHLGAQVCTCTGDRRPSVHARWRPAPKYARASGKGLAV